MTRTKYLIPLVALVALLALAVTALAVDLTPDTCLSLDGKCYASDVILDGTHTEDDPDGTALGVWLVPRDGEMSTLLQNVSSALQDPTHQYGEGPFYFAAIWCLDPVYPDCITTWSMLDDEGKIVDEWEDPGTPPEVGVEMPFGFLLGGGVFLAAAFISVGIVLRRRTR